MSTLHEMAEEARRMYDQKMIVAGLAPASSDSERREPADLTDAPDNLARRVPDAQPQG